MPSSARLYDAPVGQTGTHGGSSQCRHDFGKCTVCVFGYSPTSKVCTRLKKAPVGSRPYGSRSASGPAEPDVFHSLHDVTQAWQPTHTLRSMTNASWVIGSPRSLARAASLGGLRTGSADRRTSCRPPRSLADAPFGPCLRPARSLVPPAGE